jgi:hypothetical protein
VIGSIVEDRRRGEGLRPIRWHAWCLESVVKAFGTTVKKASKKEVEAGALEMGGDMGVLKVCLLLLKIRKVVKCGNGGIFGLVRSVYIDIFIYGHVR